MIVGGGAAGLATAVFSARAARGLRVLCLDGARRVGAKILVSGGTRCNVTNTVVSERDFWGGSSRTIRSVLRAFPAERAVAFFGELGVSLHEEEDGKLFPDSNRARTVLDALLGETARVGAELRVDERVVDVRRDGSTFVLHTAGLREYVARALVLATGGRSLPRTGSDGFGYDLARSLGHGYIDTTPALAPLVLSGTMHAGLSGVSHPAALTVRTSGMPAGAAVRLHGSMLWTHFGISGPVALNASRHWHRARLQGRPVAVVLNICPGETFSTLEQWWLEQERVRPKAKLATALATRLPGAVADVWIARAGLAGDVTVAHLHESGSATSRAGVARDAARGERQPRLQLRRSDRRRHPARGNRRGANGVTPVPATVSGRRDPRRRRTPRRFQFSVGVVVCVGGRAGDWASAFSSASPLTRKCDADQTTRPSCTRSACGVS